MVACASPIFTLPTRAAAAFAAIVKCTVALPVPADGAAGAIQSTLLVAVHWQPGVAVSVKATSVLDAPTAAFARSSEYLHGAAS
jgi:hypothetical protein